MKLQTFIISIAIVIVSSVLHAGPFLKITNVDPNTNHPKVKIHITVNDFSKKMISGLNEDNLMIYEDGFRVNYIKVKDIYQSTDNLYLVFSIDSSKSISKNFLSAIKSSAGEIVDSMTKTNQLAVYKFNDSVKLLNPFTNNKKEILRNIYSINRSGTKTQLYNSIYDSIDLLSQVDEKRKAVIVFTDGKDEGSSIRENDIIKFSKDQNIPIHFITMKNGKDIKKMARIAKLTKGKLIYSTNLNDVTGMYKTLLSYIKSKYTVEYVSHIKADGEKHKIEVRLKVDKLRDRATTEAIFNKKFILNKIKFDKDFILGILISLVVILLIILIFVIFKKEKNSKKEIGEKIYEKENEEFELEKYADFEKSDIFSESINKDSALEEDEIIYADAWLIEKAENSSGKKYPIYSKEITVGSGLDNDIIIDDKYVSDIHFKIKNINGLYNVFDILSKNGTYLNNKKILRPRLLADWDEIKIGKTNLIFRGKKKKI